MLLETFPSLNGLSVDQKLRLAYELCQNASRDPGITGETASLLEARLAEHDAHPECVRSTDQVTEGILRLKQRLTAQRQ